MESEESGGWLMDDLEDWYPRSLGREFEFLALRGRKVGWNCVYRTSGCMAKIVLCRRLNSGEMACHYLRD